MKSIHKQNAANTINQDIIFRYNALGHRISKKVQDNLGLTAKYTYYICDASGNQMATYTGGATNSILPTDITLYGSSRLGVLHLNSTYISASSSTGWPSYTWPTLPTWYGAYTILSVTKGLKEYELTNHLGNVMATVSDKLDVSISSGLSKFKAHLFTQQDYMPFGELMVGRTYTAGSSYRFGFNKGSLKDDEIYGEGNAYSTFYRELDTRTGRWWSPDPKDDGSLSSYASMDDNPIKYNDPRGDCPPKTYCPPAKAPVAPQGNPRSSTSVKPVVQVETKAQVLQRAQEQQAHKTPTVVKADYESANGHKIIDQQVKWDNFRKPILKVLPTPGDLLKGSGYAMMLASPLTGPGAPEVFATGAGAVKAGDYIDNATTLINDVKKNDVTALLIDAAFIGIGNKVDARIEKLPITDLSKQVVGATAGKALDNVKDNVKEEAKPASNIKISSPTPQAQSGSGG